MKRTFCLLTLLFVLCSCTKKAPSDIIAEQQAIDSVFERAAITDDDVENLSVSLEFDEELEIWQYAMHFEVKSADPAKDEVKAEVNAKTGTIIMFWAY